MLLLVDIYLTGKLRILLFCLHIFYVCEFQMHQRSAVKQVCGVGYTSVTVYTTMRQSTGTKGGNDQH